MKVVVKRGYRKMICYRRPSRKAKCRYCAKPVEKGEIALSMWLNSQFPGWSYVHIKCVLKASHYNHCVMQSPVEPKEAVKATRQAIADLMVDRMTGEDKDDE